MGYWTVAIGVTRKKSHERGKLRQLQEGSVGPGICAIGRRSELIYRENSGIWRERVVVLQCLDDGSNHFTGSETRSPDGAVPRERLLARHQKIPTNDCS